MRLKALALETFDDVLGLLDARFPRAKVQVKVDYVHFEPLDLDSDFHETFLADALLAKRKNRAL